MIRSLRIVLLVSIPVLALGYVLDYSPGNFSFYKDQGFDRIKVKGFTSVGEPGTPELPVFYLKYIIPTAAKAESLIIKNKVISDLQGTYNIYPLQTPLPSGTVPIWTPPNNSIYGSDDIYPDKLIEIVGEGVMDGARLVTVAVRPIQYKPKSSRSLPTYNSILPSGPMPHPNSEP